MPCASSEHQVLAGIYFTVIRPVRARRTRMCTHARPHRDAAGQEDETSHIVTYLPPSHTVTASHTAAVTYRHILFHAVLCRCIRFLMSCFARAALRSTKKLLAGFLRRTGAWVKWMLWHLLQSAVVTVQSAVHKHVDRHVYWHVCCHGLCVCLSTHLYVVRSTCSAPQAEADF